MKLQRSRSTFEALEGRQLLSGTPWGQQAKLIGLDQVAEQFPQLTGSGETVVMIDSGIDYNHPSLGGGWGKKVIGGWDYINNDSDPMSSSYAHGTGTAGMVAANPYDYKGYHYQGIAPGVKLIALREGNSDQVAAALKWVIANKAKYNIVAVNFTDFGGFNKDAGLSIKASIGTLDSMNVFVSRPSGNSGTTSGVANYYDEAVVGSVNKGDGISSFTNRGAGLDFLAPAEKVTLPYYDVGSKSHIYVDVADGTSWSAPQIAGAAALLRQINPGFTNAQISSILTQSAVQKYDSSTNRSYPRLNLIGAVKLAYQQAGKTVPTTPSTPTPPPPSTTTTTPSAPSGVVTTARTTIGASTVLQAENFDSGAEGTAYHDTDSANRGGNNYRPGTGVDINTISDQSSTRAVGYTKAGEWMKYSVNVQTAGTYSIAFRMASVGAGAQFHLEVDGKNVTGTMNVVDTKSWKTYADITKTGVSLSAGNHTLRVVFDRNGASGYVADFNLMRFTRTSSTTTTATTTPTPTTTTTFVPPKTTPFKGFNLAPGVGTVIQAEDFDSGEVGAAYKDLTYGNQAGQYRSTWMDIEKSADTNGGYDLTNLQAGEWTNYTVNVTKAGTFNLDTRVASATGGGAFHVEIDGKNVTGTMVFTNTGGLQKWTTLRKSGIAIAAGKHSVRLVIDSTGGKPYAGNINWIKFS